MTEDKQSTTNLILTVIVSSIIGGLVVYYLLKSRINTTQPLSMNTSSLENKLNIIEQKLQNQSSQVQLTDQNTIYKNNESWEILRDNKGFISKLNVLRDVKLNK